MRRFLSVWLPHWPTDRWQQRNNDHTTGPLALTLDQANHLRLYALNATASAAGLRPGLGLADARAQVPALRSAAADPLADQAALSRLADWCSRFSPWAAPDGEDGIILEITGVPHLFGGEAAMLEHVRQALGKLGAQTRLGIADTPSAAWAWARFGAGETLPAGSGLNGLGDLPVRALRLELPVIDTLNALGLQRISNIAALPRGPLARRFGPVLLERLDALLGRCDEPISPLRQPAPWRSRIDLAEPVITRDAIDEVLQRLLAALCGLLEQEQRGARQLSLHAYRVDGSVQSLSIGTARPCRDAAHLFRLFRDKLDSIEPDFGIESFLLEAHAADPFSAEQAVLDAVDAAAHAQSFAQLIDRLQARLGPKAVFRSTPAESYAPERAIMRIRPLASFKGSVHALSMRRPALLLAPPEMVDMAEQQKSFRWRRIERPIRRLEGPERLRTEWWRDGMENTVRDYYRIEDRQGRRYWLFQSLDGWFVHGLFP